MVSGNHDREEPAARYDGGDLDLAGGLMFALDVCLSDIAPGEMLELSSANAGLAHELPAWCRGTGHELVDQSGRRRPHPVPHPPRRARGADV